MKVVLQRVLAANVKVEGQIIGEIGRGYVLLVGFGSADSPEVLTPMIEKIKKLRLFPDSAGKTNLSIGDIPQGEVLIISQFTLYADCRKGTRPSFTNAAPPTLAEDLYLQFIELARPYFAKVACGSFGADMKVELINDGPFTVVLE